MEGVGIPCRNGALQIRVVLARTLKRSQRHPYLQG